MCTPQRLCAALAEPIPADLACGDVLRQHGDRLLNGDLRIDATREEDVEEDGTIENG